MTEPRQPQLELRCRGSDGEPAILELRARQRRKLMATLLFAGRPMLLAGDELGRPGRQQQCLVPGQRNQLVRLGGRRGEGGAHRLRDGTVPLRRGHPALRRDSSSGAPPHGRQPQRRELASSPWRALTAADWTASSARAVTVALGGAPTVDESSDTAVPGDGQRVVGATSVPPAGQRTRHRLVGGRRHCGNSRAPPGARGRSIRLPASSSSAARSCSCRARPRADVAGGRALGALGGSGGDSGTIGTPSALASESLEPVQRVSPTGLMRTLPRRPTPSSSCSSRAPGSGVTSSPPADPQPHDARTRRSRRREQAAGSATCTGPAAASEGMLAPLLTPSAGRLATTNERLRADTLRRLLRTTSRRVTPVSTVPAPDKKGGAERVGL